MNCDLNYYSCSRRTRQPRVRLGGLLLLAWLAHGCAGGPNDAAQRAVRLSYAELTGPQRKEALQRLTRLPVVIRFEQGERIPVDLGIDSSLLSLERSAMTLVAKRDFYLLLREDGGPLVSPDGQNFEPAEKNYFFFGFVVTRDEPTTLRVRLGVRPTGEPGAAESAPQPTAAAPRPPAEDAPPSSSGSASP